MLKRSTTKYDGSSHLGKSPSERRNTARSSHFGMRRSIETHQKSAVSAPVASAARKVVSIPIPSIVIPHKGREINWSTVRVIAKSIKKIGLQEPIEVRQAKFKGTKEIKYVLVVGNHRIEAMKQVGQTSIDAFVVRCGQSEARQRAASQDINRCNRTVLQKAERLVVWAQTFEGDQSGQPSRGGQQPNDEGVSRAAAGTGYTRQAIQRARKIAGIDPKAKIAAKNARLDNSQTALLEIADEDTLEAQLAKVRELENKKPTKQKSANTGAKTPRGAKKLPTSANEGGQPARGAGKSPYAALVDAWNRAKTLKANWAGASRSDKKKFIDEVLMGEGP